MDSVDPGYSQASKRRRRTARLSTMTCAVNRTAEVCGLRSADASACGRRSAVIVGSADWQRTGFLFRSRDVAITMNSIKILHAVRSAITAIAELSVVICYFWELVQVEVRLRRRAEVNLLGLVGADFHVWCPFCCKPSVRALRANFILKI